MDSSHTERNSDPSNLTKGLNPSQKEAVTASLGPLLVLAGAGSGKTRVLTHKIAYALQSGIYPGDILAVTFTNKAAKEMKHRLQGLVGEAVAQWLWIGTFHSICGRILRREIEAYTTPSGRSWRKNFVIYDESESMSAVKEAIKKLNLDDKLYAPKSIRYMISGFKNQLTDAHRFASEAKDFKAEKIARIYDLYEEALSKSNALDFDDMLLLTVKLLQQNPDILSRYHQKFQHILVDEFQDTNDVQYELVRLLAEGCVVDERQNLNSEALWRNRSLTVVGDVDQSIYSWRGANFRIILSFQENFPNARLIKLLENYRSSANILNVANAIIENNTERLPKELLSVKGAGEKITCYEAKDDRDEAFFVVNSLMQLVDSGKYKPGECCILYRTNVQSRVMEDLLISKGIPYTIVGGLKFYERREIKDVLAYLTVIFNEADNFSVKRVLNVPRRGVGKTSIEKLEQAAEARGVSLYEILKHSDQLGLLGPEYELRGKAIKAIGSFVQLMESLKRQAQELPLDQLILQVLDQSGYYDELRVDDPTDSEGRMANVEELVSVAKQFLQDQADNAAKLQAANVENISEEDLAEAQSDPTPFGQLADFLTQMALLSDLDGAEPAENKLLMMTVHSSKGLEYPVVALCGLEESLFPHFRSLSDAEQMEEERRLMYVAVTRAADKLFMSFARRRLVMGEFRYSQPSRFLSEAPKDLLSGFYTLDKEPSRSPEYGGRNRFDDDSRFSSGAEKTGRYSDNDWSDSHFQDETPPSRWGNAAKSSSGKPTPKKPTGYGYSGGQNKGPSSYSKNDKYAEIRKRQQARKADGALRISGSEPDSFSGSEHNVPGPGYSFNVGDRVSHPKFGQGTIAQVLGQGPKTIYGVKFDTIAGQKLLDPKVAKLEPV